MFLSFFLPLLMSSVVDPDPYVFLPDPEVRDTEPARKTWIPTVL
jgi:hypothetical protein